MKVLVDTSVWADFLNDSSTPGAELLARLIEDEVEIVTCGVVIAEVFQGIRRSSTLPALERQFRDMDCLSPREPDTYLAAARLYRDLRASGITVNSTIDCLIVTLAHEHGTFLLSSDRTIELIVRSGRTKVRPFPAM
ncbi:MAG TPA: PIN domain nuclease [Thermoanaerobaculia bacterium]|nr:PIN domain nuclease [Thermoanaerobaculia bacterium]